MHALLAFLIAGVLLIQAGAAHAAAEPAIPACPRAPAPAVVTIAQLPAEVQAILDEMGPVADAGGAFNGSDVIDPAHPVPTQRLLSGQVGPDCILLKVEKGGRGYSHGLLQFGRVTGHWQLVRRAYRRPDEPT